MTCGFWIVISLWETLFGVYQQPQRRSPRWRIFHGCSVVPVEQWLTRSPNCIVGWRQHCYKLFIYDEFEVIITTNNNDNSEDNNNHDIIVLLKQDRFFFFFLIVSKKFIEMLHVQWRGRQRVTHRLSTRIFEFIKYEKLTIREVQTAFIALYSACYNHISNNQCYHYNYHIYYYSHNQ